MRPSKRSEFVLCSALRAGESPEAVIATLGFSRPRIYEWLALYREGGLGALRAKPIPGRPPRLQGHQLKKLYEMIVGQNPLQQRFEFALWTRAMIRKLIRREFNVQLSEVSVGRLLKKMGLSPQKPLRRADHQDPVLVEEWQTEIYPKIRALAKRQGATIFFADEASVRSDYHAGTTWAPVGKTPVVSATGSRFSLSLVSAISAQGKMRFMVVDGRMNATKFCEFLKRLLHGSESPVFLIVDGHPAHRAKKVHEFVESTEGRLQLFFLPPYSPQLNPDELVWNDLKRNIGRRAHENLGKMRSAILRHLRSLQRRCSKIKAFFQESHLRYAS